MVEEWKDIEGYEGLYQVSNLGRVKSLERTVKFGRATRVIKEKILSPKIKGTCEYPQVNLSHNSTQHWVTVHRLVAQAFIPNPKNFPQVNHKDENRNNCSVDNLEWCNSKYNNNFGNHISNAASTLISKYNEGSIDKRMIPIIQYSKNGEYIMEWEGATIAAKELGIDTSTITACCRGRKKSSYGYIWRYKEREVA